MFIAQSEVKSEKAFEIVLEKYGEGELGPEAVKIFKKVMSEMKF